MCQTARHMKYIAIATLLLLAIACERNEPEEAKDDNRDTVVIKEEAPKEVEKEPEEKKEEPVTQPTEKPWKAKMARLHELNCKIHNNGATVSDRTDQVVLVKELNDIRKTLNKDDRFVFDADMVKAQDMATCPK